MDKPEIITPENLLCNFLKKNYFGAGNPVSSKVLEVVFQVKGTEIRKMVNQLRSTGNPICSDRDGYYYAANRNDVLGTVAQLNSRIKQISNARDGLESWMNGQAI